MPDRQYDANDYTVGWVCVLVLEMAAAKAMLDEIHPNLSEQAPADHNSYLLGRVQGHNVAIACVPVGMYGTTTAATVVKDMLRTFKSIRFGLLVGIGSGAPSSRHDIRLGDIVVSQLSETTGGVIKYDLGKNGREGQFERTGLLNTPPKILLTALGRLQADHYVRDSRVPEFLAESLQKYPKMKKSFSSRGELTDCLFEAEYEHAGDNTGCEQCDHARSVQRDARKNTDPVVHYGNIASGNLVIKNAGIRDQLSKDLGVLCFEMEAAGLMQDFPCLVIRGICDYADTHKNKEWQGYAAVVAAAFAKELLSVISPECVLQEKAIPQQDSGDTRYENDKQIECHRAFKTSRYEDFKNINPDRVPGTCKWVLEHPKYQKWRRSSRDDILWISADPGYGKSVLAKALIDEELDNAGDYTVCYFFFKDNEDQHSLSTALCAVLYQLFGRSPHLLRHATNAFEKHGQKLQNEVDELWRIFLAAATDSSANAVICVLDALDECQGEDRRKLVRLLTDFYYRRTSASTGSFQLKLLVTSRPYQDIETGFNHIPSELPLIRLAGEESNANLSEEINLVIRQKIAGAGDTLHPDQDVRDALQQKLLATENRTYLWLHLIWDELEQSRKHTKKAFLKKIGSLPSTVEDAYERILTRNSRGDQEEAKVLLHIVIGARRPLRVREMDVAFQLAVESLNGLQHQDLDLDSEQLKARIRELCGPIVLINNNRVHLINQTAKEFLIAKEASDASANGSWRHSLSERQSSKIMAEVCIQYLIFHDIKDERYRERKSNGILIDNFPLLEYASVNWPTHYRDMDEAGVGLFSADHPSTLTSIRRLASIYKNQGRWLEAEKLEVQVMETSMTKLGTDHPSTLTSMTSLALIYSNRGRLTEAETLHLRVIDAFMTQLGPDHPDTLTGMADLAIIYTSQGRWDDAELLQVRVLESVRKVLGEEHPSTLSALANLASTFQKQSRWKEAEELFLRVIQTKKVVFGEAHPETLNSTVRLVLLLEASGRYKEAKDYLENILQLQERFLGFHHASTISTRLMRESLVLAMGRHQPTRTEYSNSTSSEVPDSVWTAGDISTVPTDQSIVSRDRLTNKEFAPLTFFNYKLSGGGPRLDRPFDDVESVNSIADDIQSLDGSPSETETAVVSYVVKTLTADSQLFGLYREATQRLEEAKFIRNHRRLLKLFYLDLLPEGRTRQQQVAISFLRSRVARTRVSQDIYKTLNPMDRNEREKVSVILQQQRDTAFLLQRLLDGLSYETPNSMPDTTPSDTRGAVTDDIDVDCETSGSSETSKDSNLDTSAERSLSFPNLDAIGVFLTHGRPFDLFKENIRQFLHSRPGVYNDRYEFQLESMLHASSDEAPSQADLQHQSMDVLVPIPKASEETKVTQNATQDAPNLDDVTAITAGPADTACFPPFIQTAKGLMDQTNKISKNAGYNGPSRLNERLACLISELNHARPQRIDVECHLSVSWPDKLKLGLENFTQEAWNWWPLSPPRKPLKSGEVRLRWFCVRRPWLACK
jgi:nucleoside phosphorylase/tetratricopeptide (TPR) repeat protein